MRSLANARVLMRMCYRERGNGRRGIASVSACDGLSWLHAWRARDCACRRSDWFRWFGFAPDFGDENHPHDRSGEWVKIVQTGAVVIGDDVEIGANTTIDRGTMADTVIERSVKIDNLVQIAHNCRIGAYTVIAGCVGIAG